MIIYNIIINASNLLQDNDTYLQKMSSVSALLATLNSQTVNKLDTC